MANNNLSINIGGHDQASGPIRTISRSLDDLRRSASDMLSPVNALKGAFASLAVGAGLKSIIDAAMGMERLQRMMTAATGSSGQAAIEMNRVREMANRLGLDLQTAAESYGKFMAASKGSALQGEQVYKIFESVSKASTALGLSADETQGVFTALGQMMSKGKVQAEELRGQLGERLPGAFKMAADAMGITTAELDKQLKAGTVMAEDMLPKLAEQMEKTYGQAAVNGSKSATAEMNRFNTALMDTKAIFGEQLLPLFTFLLKYAINPLIIGLGKIVGLLQEAALGAVYLGHQLWTAMKGLFTGQIFTKEGYAAVMAQSEANFANYAEGRAAIWAQLDRTGAAGGAFLPPGKPGGQTGTGTKTGTQTLKAETFNIASVTTARLSAERAVTEQMLAMEKQAMQIDQDIAKEWYDKGLSTEAEYNRNIYDIKKAAITSEIALQQQYLDSRIAANEEANRALQATGIKQDSAGTFIVTTPEQNKALQQAWQAYGQAIEARTKLNGLQAEANKLDNARPLQIWQDEKAAKEALQNLDRLSLQNKLDAINAAEKFNDVSAGEAATRRIDILEQQKTLEEQIYAGMPGNSEVARLAQAKQLDSIEKINAALLEQKKILADSTATGGMIAALKEYARTAQDIGRQTKGIVADFLQGMEDALVRFVRTGKLNFTDLVNSMLDQMARVTVQQSITGPLSGWLSGMVNSLFSTGATQYLPGATTGGGLLGGTAGGGLSSLLGPLSSAVSLGAKTGTAAGAKAGVTAGMSTAAPYLAAAVGAYGIGSSLSSTFLGSDSRWGNMNTSQRTMYGLAMTNPIGWGLIGLDGLMGGSIFGGSQKVDKSGLNLAVNQGQLAGTGYAVIHTSGGAFSNADHTRKTYNLGSGDLMALNNQMAAIQQNITAGARYVGGSADLSGFSYRAEKLNFKGMTEEQQQQALGAYFKRVSDAALKELYPDLTTFTAAGESATDTFNRLASAAVTVNEFFATLGITLNDVSLQGAAASSALVEALGGLQKAQTTMASYYTSGLFTESEQQMMQLATAQRTVNTTFADLGLAIPANNIAYRELVNQYLSLGETGATTAAALLNVAGAFGTLTDFARTAADKLAEIQGGSLSTLSGAEQYLNSRNAFMTANDSTAISTASDFLTLSRSMYASGPKYAADYAMVTSRLQEIAGGVDLLPSTMTGTTATAAASTAAVDMGPTNSILLSSNAGIAAIADNSAKTVALLESIQSGQTLEQAA